MLIWKNKNIKGLLDTIVEKNTITLNAIFNNENVRNISVTSDLGDA